MMERTMMIVGKVVMIVVVVVVATVAAAALMVFCVFVDVVDHTHTKEHRHTSTHAKQKCNKPK